MDHRVMHVVYVGGTTIEDMWSSIASSKTGTAAFDYKKLKQGNAVH